MAIYILLAVLLALCARYNSSKTLSFVVFLILILVSSFRSYYVGTDTANYLFNNIEQGNIARYLSEPLSYILFRYSPNNEFFIYAESALALLPVFLIHKKFQKPYLIIFLYYLLGFYFFSFNITRQMIAAGFVLLAVIYYIERKWSLYILFMIIAFGYHNTSIVALILPLCDRYLFINKVMIYLLLPVTFVIGVIASSQFFNLFAPIIGDYIIYGSTGSTGGGFSLNRLLLNVFFLIVYNCSSYEGKRSLYMKSMFISIIIYNLLSFSTVVNRVAMYFSISEIILLSQRRYVKLSQRRIYKSAVYFYGFSYFSLVLINNLGGVVPYEMNPIYKSGKAFELLFMCIGTIVAYYILDYITTHSLYKKHNSTYYKNYK